ncbi:hypothetical protein QOZ80_5BG0454530 [Eleusine coracana subsp. coracana]|nr:hypothetical protein QOZ80_5BG0454530 [Eleusine coracana subsp. coracana]
MPPPPPELSDDLVGETLLRLPPDDPACLLRASLVCKRWRRILADPAFRRRHRALYRAPSVVGFIRIVKGATPFASRFVPNDPASGRPAARELPGWLPLDCRHGRALFLATSPSLGTALNYDFIVWDPLTNEQRHLPRPSPPPVKYCCNAAVLCAAATEGCDHRGCHKGPFFVVFVWFHGTDYHLPLVTSARVYSSVSGDWSEPISVQHSHASLDTSASFPSALVGDKLYFNCLKRYSFEYVLGVQSLSVIEQPPPSLHICMLFPHMPMEDGRLGCVEVEDEPKLCLRLWWRLTAAEGDGVAYCWERGRAIELETLLPEDGALPTHPLASVPSSKPASASVLGFAEGTDIIFLGTNMRDHTYAVHMIHLNSGRARKVFEKGTIVVPYTSFCIPGFN